MKLSQKLMFSILAVLILIGIPATYVYYRTLVSLEMRHMSLYGDSVGSVIVQSIGQHMMKRDLTALDRVIGGFKEIDFIKNVSLINNENIVKVSTEGGRVNSKLSPDYIAQSKKGKLGGDWLVKEDIYRWIQPIYNRHECHSCHDASQKLNGALIIDFSISRWHKQIRDNLREATDIFLPSIAFLGLIVLIITRRVVIKRLENLSGGLRRFKDGDYSVRIDSRGRDEISELAERFNEMAVDVTEREREKDILFRKIEDSYNEWLSTFNSITDMISIEDHDHNIIRVNKAFVDYFGVQDEETLKRKCRELYNDASDKIETSGSSEPVQTEILDTVAGKTLRLTVFPIRFSGVHFEGYIYVARDITKEKENEAQLIINERLASLGQMASGIAHEINNPLAAIAGCTEGLLMRISRNSYDPAFFTEYLRIIQEEIGRCKSITTSMLSFVRQNTYERKDVDVNLLIDKTLEVVGYQGRLRQISVIRKYSSDLPLIKVNEGEIRQVFISILTNAIDAMQEAGEIIIETGMEEGRVFASFKDFGPGIQADYLNKIFDPFFTTKSDKGGTGLGLSISMKIVSNHNGNIFVHSEEGKGATFRVVLPVDYDARHKLK